MDVESRRALGSRYELIAPIGRGAMGRVWRAADRADGTEVAAKLLRSELARDREIVGRFIQERSILMGLDHPGIVKVRDLVVEGDDLAIVMDLVQGSDLRARLRQAGTFAPRLAVELACAVLDALAAAHASGCLHRDVKPDNVLVAVPGEFGGADLRLTDFGIARLAQESTVMATGLLGTPGYMPPELFVHGTFSAASDVYAVGVLLYELLAGRTPFAGPGTAHTIGNRHVTAAPPRLPVADELWHALATMLAKDPALRLTAAGTAEQLRALPPEALAGDAIGVQPEPGAWDDVRSLAPVAPVHVRETPAGVDVGATFVPASDSSLPPVAVSGELRAVDSAAAPMTRIRADETRIGRPAEPAARPVLEPKVAPPGAHRRRRWLPWAVAATVVVALGLGGWGVVSVLGGDGGPGPGAGAAAASRATAVEDPLPTGLGVTRTASYDPESGTVDLTVRYAAQGVPLAGPFLEVLPPAEAGEQCPLAAWDGAEVGANLPQVSGIGVPCGFAIDPAEPVPAQGSVEVHAEVSVSLPPGPDALDAWLASVADTTAEALAAQPVGTAYPAQRLARVEVEVPSEVRVGTRTLRVRLLPVWRGAEQPDRINVLFDSTAVGRPPALLDQVAGGIDGVRLADGCGGALAIVNRLRVGVMRAADSCTVEAQLGNFTGLVSPTFRISRAGG